MIIEVHQVDAFTDKIFGGNPAGVVSNADKLTDAQMLSVAREMNLSETAFVLPSKDSTSADIRLRYFTTVSEVDFCGHATVGTLYELSRLGLHGLDKQGIHKLSVETNTGILKMTVSRDGQATTVSFVAPTVALETYDMEPADFAKKIGIAQGDLLPNTQIFRDSVLNYLYVPIASLAKLEKMAFDFPRLREQFAKEKFVVLCFYTNDTFDKQANLHARVIGPFIGIIEDPFTGSTQAGMVAAAKRNALIAEEQQNFTTEQGNIIDRPGFARVSINKINDTYTVQATAAHVFSTSMSL